MKENTVQAISRLVPIIHVLHLHAEPMAISTHKVTLSTGSFLKISNDDRIGIFKVIF